MELKDLYVFLKVVQQGSFTKAAEEMYVSQPTLSKSLKSLEKELQVKLLERSTKSLALTDAGSIVYSQSMKIFQLVDELEVLLSDLKKVEFGEVKVGIPPLIGTLFFSKIASKFNTVYPNVTLQLTELGAKRIGELVEEGIVHVGFVVLPIDEQKFDTKVFIEDEFVLFVSDDHFFADREIISIEELKEESFILFNRDFTLHDRVIDACNTAGFNPFIAFESSQWDVIIELVAANLGVTLLPRAIYTKQSNPKIKIVKLSERMEWKVGVITKRNAYIPYAVQKFLLECIN
ncbi:LysR family transcriptional regulator [Ureibacillus manganicus]|uniref:LysR family transcriptional regulator n=1 Tax=Ureibacillus manganicus DSM 26584 TaxID=1384049 RepID=A0A0A3I5C6_9BACL|nr:LysR family transcriptional regulator [Ureibacillus manganicus]KGR78715.1 LysR family transcriptional regulator [Ureibacillus manganicus DSM 26584]